MVLGLVMATAGFAAEPDAMAILETLEIRDGYAPGNGLSIGSIRQTYGTVVIVHQDQSLGFKAVPGCELFKNDLVITGKDGSTAFRLADGSFISLSPGSAMRINQVSYAPKQKTRSAFVNMLSGKARFVVKKFVDARHSEFKVKTKTSVAGVRGSDFIISSSEMVTEIITLEQTALAVISLAHPEAEPVMLKAFERTEVRAGMLPEEVQRTRAEDIDRLMKEFMFQPPAAPIEQEMGLIAAGAGVAADTETGPEKIYVPPSELDQPRMAVPEPDSAGEGSMGDLFRSGRMLMDEQAIKDNELQIYEDIQETQQKEPLPDFPGTP